MDQHLPNPVLLRADTLPGCGAKSAGLRPATTVLVAVAHLAIIGAAIVAFPKQKSVPKPDIAIAVVFEPPAPPQPPQILAEAALPAPSVSEESTLGPIAPLNLPAEMRNVPPHTARHRATPSPAQPVLQQTAMTQQTTPPHAPAAPVHQAPAPNLSPHALDAWEARVHQAVQNALIYPNAARLMHREGRTRVRFEYGHNAVSSAAVAESSGSSSLDQAALGAVTRAVLPLPPPEIAGQTRSLILWVNFSLTTEG